MEGLIHIYTGEGKGKTTAAIGLAVRAAGAGKKVWFSQFMKGQKTSELNSLAYIPGIETLRSDRDFPFFNKMTDEDKQEQRKIHDAIICRLIEALDEDRADVIILDELTYPYEWNLVDVSMVEELLDKAKGKCEVIITGRNPVGRLMDRADYITDMKCVRHPYDKGITARLGIEY